jgi:death-on-curing protein
MIELEYLKFDAAVAIHQHIVESSGGAFGLRDGALLISALERPKNLAHYEPSSDIFELAAIIIVGIAANHPFFDGNKRCALMCGLVFLSMNGVALKKMKIAEARALMIGVVRHEVSEAQVSIFLRESAVVAQQ